jgi:hypothetical protein
MGRETANANSVLEVGGQTTVVFHSKVQSYIGVRLEKLKKCVHLSIQAHGD